MGRPLKKERQSFTLSRESVTYIDTVRRQRRSPSRSSVLDELIRERKREDEKAQIEAKMKAYYDSLTDEQVAGDRLWGEFAEGEISAE
jgi:hypothetical protein